MIALLAILLTTTTFTLFPEAGGGGGEIRESKHSEILFVTITYVISIQV